VIAVNAEKVLALALAEHNAMTVDEQNATLACAEESLIECGDDEYGGGMPPMEFRQVLTLLNRERKRISDITAERDRFALELARMKLTEQPLYSRRVLEKQVETLLPLGRPEGQPIADFVAGLNRQHGWNLKVPSDAEAENVDAASPKPPGMRPCDHPAHDKPDLQRWGFCPACGKDADGKYFEDRNPNERLP
jgi:hypothetical protein